MIKKSSTLISGLLAFGIYVAVITLLLFYFNSKEVKKPLHYVKKNEERIRVSMAAPKPEKEIHKETKKIVKPKPKPKPKKAVKKQVVKKKVIKKKVIKEKVVKKAKTPKKIKDVNSTKPKKINKPKDLFANVSSKKKVEEPKKTAVPQKPKKRAPDKPSATALLFDSLKTEKKSDRGIEDAYLAKIEEKLKGWPAQSDYAGEMAKVLIRVEPNGSFEFKVITASGNEAFNAGLIAYLKQLQVIGFDQHKGNRAYDLNVEFVARD
jgi:protein TonB